ncbi:Ff.00g045930.m01.CDS01 [Fusarium sp. VM40]|nr:Ff.00g045930.m01.CDS01 [Fusarium sp. VM40]
MAENGDVLLFNKFVHLVETRTNKNIQAWEKQKSNLLANLEQIYQRNCLNGDNELSKTVSAPLEQYHAKVKDGIRLLFDDICATHRTDTKAIKVATGRLAEDAKAHYFQRNSHYTEDLEHQMEMLRAAGNLSQDPSSTEPGATRIEEGKTKTNKSSPASAGLSFERAHNNELLGKKRNRKTPSRPATTHWESQKSARNQTRGSSTVGSSLFRTDSFDESPTPVASVTNPRSRRSSGSSSRSRESLFSTGSPSMGSSWLSMGSSLQMKKSPAASRRVPADPEGSSNHQSLTLSELLNQGEVLENKDFEGIHPVMGDLLQYGTILNLEYEEGLIAIDSQEPEWETEDEDGEGEGKEEWGEDQLPQQVEALRSKLNRKKNLLVKAKSEIFELRRQKDDFWTACQFLLERKQEFTEPHETAEESAPPGTTTRSFSPTTQSGNQTRTSGPDSTVALPSMRDRFAELLDSHQKRLEIAVKRCDDEQVVLESKISNAESGLDPQIWDTLQHWLNTLTAHRDDFSLTVEFFNGAIKDARTNPDSLNLADEIGDTPLSMTTPSTSSQVPNSGISNRTFQPTRPGRMRSKSEVPLPVAMPSLISRAETFGSRSNSVDSAIAEDPEPDSASNSKDDITESQVPSTPAVIQSDGSKSVVSSKAGDSLVKMVKNPDSPKKPDYSEEDDSPKGISPKKSDSPRKGDSSNQGDSQEKENSSEDGENPEKDEPPEEDVALGSNPSKTSRLSTSARSEGDDDPDYPQDDLTPREDQFVNIFRWLYHKLWILLLNVLYYVVTQFGAWARFLKFVYQIVAYPFRAANGSTTTFNLPRAQDVRSIANQVLFAMTLHLYLDLQRERNQWYDANGITRNMMLARIANPQSWSSFLGVDRVLKLGGYLIYALWLPFYTFLVWLTSIPSGLWNIVDCMLHLLGVYQLPRFFRDILWLLYELKDFLYCCYLGIRGDDGAGYCFSSLRSPGFKGILEEYRRFSKFF